MNYKKFFAYILVIMMSVIVIGCTDKNDETKENSTNKQNIMVGVSIAPQETFVKAIGGDLVEVVTMIPSGYSPANYQPTPKEMAKLSDAKIYFSIGVPAEKSNILPNIEDLNKDIDLVYLADIVGSVYEDRNFDEEHEHNDEHADEHDDEHADEHDDEHADEHEDEHADEHEDEHADEHEDEHADEHTDENHDDHDHSGRDPHIWLSPKRVKLMVTSIKDELIKLDPDNKEIYEKNADEYITELSKVDNEIKDILSEHEGQSFIIYHPSFGYFADDYNLNMVTIEQEGKEATAKKLQEVIDFAKKEKIKFVFYQEEFDSQQAETIAKEINGTTIKVAPLDPNYIENLKSIADKFKEVLK